MLTLFQNYLSSKGINFTNGNSVISFENNGLQYLFAYDETDPYYFRLLLPNVVNIDDTNEHIVNEAMNELNLNFKVVKAVINNHAIWISVEQFVYSHDNISELFNRSVSILDAFINAFRKKIKI